MPFGTRPRFSARRPALGLLCAALMLSVLLAACGSSSNDSEDTGSAAATIDAQHAAPTPTMVSVVQPTMMMSHEQATSTAPAEATSAATVQAVTPTSAPSPEPSAVAPTETVEVHIVDFGFDPPMVSIPAGTTVTFINDGVDHTATSKEGAPMAFDTGILHKGQSFNVTFDTIGNIDYWCLLHPNMVGMVMVY